MNILFLDTSANKYYDAIYSIIKETPDLKCTKSNRFEKDEYDMYILNENIKLQTSKPCVFVMTTNPYVQDASSFVYNTSNDLLNLHTNISSIWLIDIYEKYKDYMETLYKIPVQIIPFSYLPQKIDTTDKQKLQKLDIVLYDSNQTFDSSTLKSMYICNEFYRTHPDQLGTVFLLNMPDHDTAQSMLESFDIWKDKKLRIFKNLKDHDIVRFFKNNSNYSVFLSNTNLETIPTLLFDLAFNDIPILHTQSGFDYGIYYNKNNIEDCLTHLANFQTLKNTNTIQKLGNYVNYCKSVFYKTIFGKELVQTYTNIHEKSYTDLNDLSRPIVITYDNEPNENTRFYIKTLKTNDWDYILIGKGETWDGWQTRMKAYIALLATLHPDKLVILSDARDVICCRSSHAFMDAYKSFRCDMVVSMELLCDNKIVLPDNYVGEQGIAISNYWNYHSMQVPDRKFVNNGLICGKARILQEELIYGIDNQFQDDQKALGCYVNTHPECVGVDTNADIFHTTSFGAYAALLNINLQKADSPTFAELFGRAAFFLHIPGMNMIKGAKTIYMTVKSLIEAGISDELFRSGYPYEQPVWKPKEPITIQGQTLGAYYQCFKNPGCFLRTIESFQSFYPESTIVVSNDGGDDFSTYCKHIQTNPVHYTYYPKTRPASKQLAYGTIEPLLDFLKRLWESFPKFKESHILLLEDDVRVVRRHTVKFENTINGMNPAYELFEPMKDILRKKGYTGHVYLGGCGGCVLDKHFYERIPFSEIEALLRSVPPIPVYASDVSLVFIALYYGGSINNYAEFAEMFYPNVSQLLIDNKVAFMHQVKHDYNKPLSNDDAKKIGIKTGTIQDIISNVIYINLDHRVDRNEFVRSQLRKVFPNEIIHRFSAIKHDIGAFGCTMSHIAALEKAQQAKWQNVLIVEDDFEFTADSAQINRQFCDVYKTPHDVILFGGSKARANRDGRLRSTQSTLNYFVESHYYSKLIENLKEGLGHYVRTRETWNYACDVYWNKLIKDDKWYILNPMVCKQKTDYSDIEKKDVDYDEWYSTITIVDE